MIDVSLHRWKYLREAKNQYFKKSRNTTLSEYLSVIFPNNDFIYDSMIPKDILLKRNPDAEYRRFRPDARSENLNLIIEVDGINHYRDTAIVITDQIKNNYLKSLGYKIVRIPYWLQLSNEVISYLFDVVMNEEMCTLIYSFSDTSLDDYGLTICPGSMCEAGRYRFIDEFMLLPECVKINVRKDLIRAIKNRQSDIPIDYVVPKTMCNKLGIDLYGIS